MKNLLLLLLACSAIALSAQEVLDTVYYDTNWKGCSKTFSRYYRVMTIPTNENSNKQFRDFYLTGEVRREGNYVIIDKKNDNNTIFDGEVITYYKSGAEMEINQWNNGHLEGDAVSLYENGIVKSHRFYNNHGQLDGIVSFFDINGNIIEHYEYSDGISKPYFTQYNQFGPQGHYDISTKEYVPEQVSISNMKEKFIRQKKYYYYDDKNGISLCVDLESVKKYGKYYGIFLTLFNNTNSSFIFYPEQIKATGRFLNSKELHNKIKTHQGTSYNNWIENRFGGLLYDSGDSKTIDGNLLIENNTTTKSITTIDTISINSATNYRYRLSMANLSAKQNKKKNEDTSISAEESLIENQQWGLVFNYLDNHNYYAVLLSLDYNHPQSMNVSLVQYHNNTVTELSSATLTKGVSLNDDMNTICVDILDDDVYVSIGNNVTKKVLESKIQRQSGIVHVGYLVGPNSRIGIEWATLSEITLDSNESTTGTNLINNESVLPIKQFGQLPPSTESRSIKVWNYDDYIKKVENRQAWDQVLMAVATAVSTIGAGTTVSNSTVTTYGSSYGYGYGYVSGSSTSHISTISHDATAAAIARERAAYNMAIYSSSLNADTEEINENYLMATTLDPQTQISGLILVNKDKPDILDISIPVNGTDYYFRIIDLPQ